MVDQQYKQATKILEDITKQISGKFDASKAQQSMSQLKMILAQMGLLGASPQSNLSSSTDVKALVLTRDSLEIGALFSVKISDVEAFERYMVQLHSFYFNSEESNLPESSRMYFLLGLNLVNLLSQNRISEFHTLLERIDPIAMQQNQYVKHAIKIEQCLMEGSFNKIWKCRNESPAEEFILFMDIMMGTVRSEIATCAEMAYHSLPLPDAINMMFFKDSNDFSEFSRQRNWSINASERRVYFPQTEQTKIGISTSEVTKNLLDYARELERIV